MMTARKTLAIGVLAVILGGLLALATRERPVRHDAQAPGDRATKREPAAVDDHRAPARRRQGAELVATARTIETDTSSPAYDPVALARAMSSREVFRQEPRHAVWAAAMEQSLAPAVKNDAARVPGISDIVVECRTSGCQFSWTAATPEADEHVVSIFATLWMGAIGNGKPGSFVTFFRGPRFAGIDPTDPGQLLDRLKQNRRESLAQARRRYERGDPWFSDLPLTYLPES
jgi:hypothetical protein